MEEQIEIGIKIDNEIIDLQTAKEKNLTGSSIYLDNTVEALEILRHSTAHLLAQAISELYTNAKFYVGPTIEDGFYYDFKVDEKISDEDLKKIEKQMKKLASKKYKIEKYNISKEDAIEKFKDDHLKQAVFGRIDSDTVSIYKQNNFEDLCRGPHLPDIRYIRNFKLTKISGAYIGGNSKNEMITRIYGVAFNNKDSLNDYVKMVEEAEKRDHRKLGHDLKLFTFSEEIGAGLPIWLPAGARLRSRLEQLLFKAHRLAGYQPVRGPEILKSDLWKKSGHYQNYSENMYFTKIDEGFSDTHQEYGIKPMNCVGHIKVYEEDIKSYRDLPLKFFEYGVVHRHELSGALHGLLRVREFTQDDAHIFCTPNQIKDNIIEVLGFVDNVMKKFGFNYDMMVSTKPEKAIGDDSVWEIATKAITDALDENGHQYGIDEGGGAFYGPKIDIKITDALKRQWQCGTIQIDFNLPERFELTYVNENNEKAQPVMIHRAILGSFERFIAILIEHFAGEFPFFIAPTQVIFVPIAESHIEYAKKLSKDLLKINIDSEIYDRNESLNKRIRTAEKQKVPMVIIIGDKEIKEDLVAIRDRRTREQYTISRDEFISLVNKKINEGNF